MTRPAVLRNALSRLTAENLVALVLAVVQPVTASAFLHAEARGAQEVALRTGWNPSGQKEQKRTKQKIRP